MVCDSVVYHSSADFRVMLLELFLLSPCVSRKRLTLINDRHLLNAC